MKYRTVYIFRHSQTYANKKGIFAGWMPSKLTPHGINQAKKIAKKLKNKKIDIAFSSDMDRAIQTLKEVLKYHKGVSILIDARLRERNYGKLTGTSKGALHKKNPRQYHIWHRSYNIPPPGGESFRMVNARVRPFIKDLLKIMKQFKVNVAISAHGNSIRPLRQHFEKLTIHQMRTIVNPHNRYWAYRVKV